MPPHSRNNDESIGDPRYLHIPSRELRRRYESARDILASCELCPHRCRVDRTDDETGLCQSTATVRVSSHQAHFGEERPLVGTGGSGTIFFAGCNLRCVFCQNSRIAHQNAGRRVTDEELAELMLDLQHKGCHNINFVTPTHYMPQILHATQIARDKGLRLPLCYNTGGYELSDNLEVLDGIIDIYLMDFKFFGAEAARTYTCTEAEDYPTHAREAALEMHRQVGDLKTDKNAIARSGLMLRHLVMPEDIAQTQDFATWVAENLSPHTFVNVMSQYRPAYLAEKYPQISRPVNGNEYSQAVRAAENAGLTRVVAR